MNWYKFWGALLWREIVVTPTWWFQLVFTASRGWKYLLRHLFASTFVYKTVSSTNKLLIRSGNIRRQVNIEWNVLLMKRWLCGDLDGLLGTNLKLLWWGLTANFALVWHRHVASWQSLEIHAALQRQVLLLPSWKQNKLASLEDILVWKTTSHPPTNRPTDGREV